MNDEYTISRRKTLAALGTIGVASAGAGLGTTAYFSDQETFENNRLIAGELDLKVDWEEHYSDWSADESTDLANDVLMENPDSSDYVGLPDPESPLVWVHVDDLGQFMDNTAVEAYPDPDDDGIQDPFASEPGTTTGQGVGYICEDGADVPDDLDPTVADSWRTEGDDTLTDSNEVKPLVAIDDVKPGDFGELTLSFHLCDNPGYVWVNGGLDYNAENGLTEPEAEDPDENNEPGDEDTGMDGELLGEIQTRLWYDDGDNVVEVGDDDRAYLTPQLSLGELLLFLAGGNGIRLCANTDTPVVEQQNGDGSSCPTDADYDSLHVTGDTVTIDTPLTGGPTDYTIPKNPKCFDMGLLEGLKTDEASEGPLPESGTKTYTTPYGDVTVTTDLVGGVQTITDWSISDDGYCVAKVVVKGGNAGANVYSYDNPDGDDDFTDDALGAKGGSQNLQTPIGQDISHVEFCLKVDTDDGNGTVPPLGGEECCFEPSTDHYVGLAWWLPVDHANELQSDSVGFDLGFYTEQCRHNDGSGMNSDEVTNG